VSIQRGFHDLNGQHCAKKQCFRLRRLSRSISASDNPQWIRALPVTFRLGKAKN
jgi:hypothetical protein